MLVQLTRSVLTKCANNRPQCLDVRIASQVAIYSNDSNNKTRSSSNNSNSRAVEVITAVAPATAVVAATAPPSLPPLVVAATAARITPAHVSMKQQKEDEGAKQQQ